ncbi:MAG TPA: hypothetical protein DCM73_08305 [Clostridiales bacterium]|nr:hypothetical protein [Clostridiales bacterium]
MLDKENDNGVIFSDGKPIGEISSRKISEYSRKVNSNSSISRSQEIVNMSILNKSQTEHKKEE